MYLKNKIVKDVNVSGETTAHFYANVAGLAEKKSWVNPQNPKNNSVV
jgi:hypothetical protein